MNGAGPLLTWRAMPVVMSKRRTDSKGFILRRVATYFHEVTYNIAHYQGRQPQVRGCAAKTGNHARRWGMAGALGFPAQAPPPPTPLDGGS